MIGDVSVMKGSSRHLLKLQLLFSIRHLTLHSRSKHLVMLNHVFLINVDVVIYLSFVRIGRDDTTDINIGFSVF